MFKQLFQKMEMDEIQSEEYKRIGKVNYISGQTQQH